MRAAAGGAAAGDVVEGAEQGAKGGAADGHYSETGFDGGPDCYVSARGDVSWCLGCSEEEAWGIGGGI